MAEHSKFNPRKYLHPYENADSPYFGVVGITDDDPKIGTREYVVGKQSLIVGNKVLIVDWRKSEVSKFFYEYDEGEDYDIEIQGVDRSGLINFKREHTITKKELVALKTASNRYSIQNGTWVSDALGEVIQVSSAIKSANSDHQLIDIVALIKPDQFQVITREIKGTIYLTGGAGTGKTTVALHRLSCLQFNEPEKYAPTKCMVIVFNKTLKDYVKNTSKELLGDTKIETFSSWAIQALESIGCQPFELSTEMNYHNEIKKHSDLAKLLDDYIGKTKKQDDMIEDLLDFYISEPVVETFFSDANEAQKYIDHIEQTYTKNNDRYRISFADMAILLRLAQLRSNSNKIDNAINYFDHIVVDEAQDFSRIELEAIYASMNENKSLTLCADEKQKILSFVDSTGLKHFKVNLQKNGLDASSFTVGYRSHPQIMMLADHVAGKRDYQFDKTNDIVKIINTESRDKAINDLIAQIQEYQEIDKNSLTAIITKGRSDVRIIHDALSDELLGIKNLRPQGQIVFTPGVIVTNAHQVKGLEFTNVIIWNPSIRNYTKTDEDKNLLYVAISRASKRICIIGYDKMSAWIAPK
jgi:DNA helicase IV